MNLPEKIAQTVRLLGPRRFAKLAVDRLIKHNPIRPWTTDTEFLRLGAEIADHTLVEQSRLYMLFQLLKRTRHLPSAAAEIGVYKGGTAKLMSRVFGGQKTVHLFDTFAGMPDTHPTFDFHVRGDFADTSVQAVRAFLSDCAGVEIHQGVFPQSAADLPDQRFAFVHVDVDIYPSVLSCCEYFFPRLDPGGVMLFDDYGIITCPGAKRGVDEFCAAQGLEAIYLPTGQALLLR